MELNIVSNVSTKIEIDSKSFWLVEGLNTMSVTGVETIVVYDGEQFMSSPLCPKIEFQSTTLSLFIKDYLFMSVLVSSTYSIDKLSINENSVKLLDYEEVTVTKERPKSANSLNDEVICKELSPNEFNKVLEKTSHRKYKVVYSLVLLNDLKTHLAFCRPFQFKIDNDYAKTDIVPIDMDTTLSKTFIIYKGTQKCLIYIESSDILFDSSKTSLGAINPSFLYNPKVDYTPVLEHLAKELKYELFQVHSVMFGDNDRKIDKNDYNLFKNKLECLGIIKKYKTKLSFILKQQNKQDSFESAYLSISSQFQSYFSLNPIQTSLTTVPYTTDIQHSIYIAKLTQDKWALQFYYDQSLIMDPTEQSKLKYARYLMYCQHYDQAYELLLSFVTPCPLEFAICELYLGHLDSCTTRCINCGDVVSLLLLHFKLNYPNALDKLISELANITTESIQATAAFLDEMGLFELTDDLLRAVMSKCNISDCLLEHLLQSHKFEDAKVLSQPSNLTTPLLLLLCNTQVPDETIQQLLQSTPSPLQQQLLLWISTTQPIPINNYAHTLELSCCSYIYEKVYNAPTTTPEQLELIKLYWSSLSPHRKEPIPITPIQLLQTTSTQSISRPSV